MKTIREIRITDTMTRKKTVFVPREPGKVSFYSCGPTVYGLIHIGNLRGGLVADMIYRYLTRVGYEVTYVRNYTDVDDKVIKKALAEKRESADVAREFTREVEKDYAVAGMLEPTHKPTVTDHMPEIVSLIEKIIKEEKAYVAADGEVLFSTESFKGYGKLSGKPLEDLIAGHRVEVSEKKKGVLDFTLWKPAKPGEPSWESPWCKGRPGWHIECSAMAAKWLGEQIDLHHGGEDLIFPHHENEIAQTEAASSKDPFVKYWVHHAFLTLSKQKMSKSLGNVFTARDFLTKFGGEVARYLLLSTHYRSPIDFDEVVLDNALTALARLYEAKQRASELLKTKKAVPDMRAENLWGEFVADCEKTKLEIDACYANDFNTAGALGATFTLIRNFNRTLSEPSAQATPTSVLGAQALLQVIEYDLGGVLGVGRLEPSKMLDDLKRIAAERSGKSIENRMSADQIESQIQARATAKKDKNFAEADRIRKELDAAGVILKDSPQGTKWEYKA